MSTGDDDRGAGCGFLILILFGGWFLFFRDKPEEPYIQGDLSDRDGTPTFRTEYTPTYYDDLYTTNDESNDQPIGFYGTETVYACNGSSGNCYDLDADFSDGQVERLYFPKGGWVDMYYSDCDTDYCYAEDENGTEWEIEW